MLIGLTNISLATGTTGQVADVEFIISSMKGVSDPIENPTQTGLWKAINVVIGLMQIAGTGISLIVVTMLGIKYVWASVEQKAEIKKQAIPIIIGCVLLFGAVNLMAAIEEFAQTAISTGIS